MLNESYKKSELITLPVIMLSSSTDIQAAARAIHFGIAEFLPKSNVTPELLNNTINDVLFKNQLKKEIIETNKKLEKSNKMLWQKNEEISNFYQVVSHELKNPLTSTYEFINILLDGLAGELTAEQKEYLTICRRNCQQLTQYMNDLLEIGRISTRKYPLNKEYICANQIVLDAINTSYVLARRKKH